MTLIIRPLRPEDIPSCVSLAREGWDRRTAVAAFDELNHGASSNPYRPTFPASYDNPLRVAQHH